MKITIPRQEDKRWLQINEGEYAGNVYATMGIDFRDSRGNATLGAPIVVELDSSTDDFGLPVGVARHNGNDKFFVICGGVIFKGANLSDPLDPLEKDTEEDSPTILGENSDIVNFDENIIVSTSSDLWKWDGIEWTANWWTAAGALNQSSLSPGPHPLASTFFGKRLLIGDGNLLHMVDYENNVFHSRLIFPVEMAIEWIRATENDIWIGCRNTNRGQGMVYNWDGATERTERVFETETHFPMACAIKDGIPYIFEPNGRLAEFDGGRFVTVAKLPGYNPDKIKIGGTLILTPARILGVHRNGMLAYKNEILINLNSSFEEQRAITELQPSGVWCWDGESFYNKHSYFLNDKVNSLLQANNTGMIFNDYNREEIFLGYAVDNEQGYVEGTKSVLGRIATRVLRKNVGYIITPKITSTEVSDIGKSFVLKAYLERDNDEINIKYRTKDEPHSPNTFVVEVTWTNGKTFTTTVDIDAFGEGDEVLITNSAGAGFSEHIESITKSNGTRTVILERDIPEVENGDKSLITISNWKKLKSFTGKQNIYDIISLGEESNWIQFKLELRGERFTPRIEETQIITEPSELTE